MSAVPQYTVQAEGPDHAGHVAQGRGQVEDRRDDERHQHVPRERPGEATLEHGPDRGEGEEPARQAHEDGGERVAEHRQEPHRARAQGVAVDEPEEHDARHHHRSQAHDGQRLRVEELLADLVQVVETCEDHVRAAHGQDPEERQEDSKRG